MTKSTIFTYRKHVLYLSKETLRHNPPLLRILIKLVIIYNPGGNTIITMRLGSPDIPHDITLVHCMDGIMLIVLYEQEEAHTTVQVHSKEWKTKPGVQGLPASVKYLGMQWFGTRRNISSEAKHKLLYFTTPTMTNEAECLVVLIRCQRQHVPFLRTLLLHVYWWHGLKWALNKNCKWPYCLGHMTQQSLWS